MPVIQEVIQVMIQVMILLFFQTKTLRLNSVLYSAQMQLMENADPTVQQDVSGLGQLKMTSSATHSKLLVVANPLKLQLGHS